MFDVRIRVPDCPFGVDWQNIEQVYEDMIKAAETASEYLLAIYDAIEKATVLAEQLTGMSRSDAMFDMYFQVRPHVE